MSWSIVSMTVVFPFLLVILLALDLVGPAMKSVESPGLRTNRWTRSPMGPETEEIAL
ncbi:MAG TPA: hypothetical protein VNK46_16455 [Nitrospiraceae bacterium]|jgi:hypothetical protein|nr:hypothetical protein [Nitrospiraceae bacterium]